MSTLRGHLSTVDEQNMPIAYGPGDDIPEWLAARLRAGNPSLLADDETAAAEATLNAAAKEQADADADAKAQADADAAAVGGKQSDAPTAEEVLARLQSDVDSAGNARAKTAAVQAYTDKLAELDPDGTNEAFARFRPQS